MDSKTHDRPIRMVANHLDCRYVIEEDSEVGFYVHRFEGLDLISSHDHLQDNLSMATAFALEEWGVPLDAWKRQPVDDHNGGHNRHP